MDVTSANVVSFIKYKGNYYLPTRSCAEFMAELEDMDVREDDIFIITFPKSGTHWMQEIVHLILVNGESEKVTSSDREMALELAAVKIPSEENMRAAGPGLRRMKNKPSPRVLITHVPYALLPKGLYEKMCKVIYVHRHPKDVLVSYYTNRRKLVEAEFGTPVPHTAKLFAHFFDVFISNNAAYGGWFDHVSSYYQHINDDNFYIISYEALKDNPLEAVKQIAAFLDKDLDNEALSRVVQHSSIEAMRKAYDQDHASSEKQEIEKNDFRFFIDRGQVGQWKQFFTEEQTIQFDKLFLEKMLIPELRNAYLPFL